MLKIQNQIITFYLKLFHTYYSVFVPHDHLLLREPSRVVFFTTTAAEKVWPLLKTLAPDANLRQIWDIVELLR